MPRRLPQAAARRRARISPAHPSVGAGLPPAAAPALAEPVTYLSGTWSLERRLEDVGLGVEGRFVGIARLEPAGDGRSRYREQGLLEWQGYRGQASRTLTVAPAGPATATFSFPDGRFFHLLQLRPDGYEVVHECGSDRYAGTFVLVGPDAWTATWRVDGPRKELLLAGEYTRLPARPAGG